MEMRERAQGRLLIPNQGSVTGKKLSSTSVWISGWLLLFHLWPSEADVPVQCVWGHRDSSSPAALSLCRQGQRALDFQQGKGKGRGKEGKGKGKGREGAHPCCCLRRTLGCPSMLNYKQLPALLALPVFSWGTEAQVLT